jgi:sugar O-acyltransferase (sialic acid O-acetyltransferase NeuD family)
MSKVIIFGLNDFAELAYYYLTNDSNYDVVGFSVNKEFLQNGQTFKDLPVFAFEDIEKTHNPDLFLFFAPMSPTKMNRDREKIYNEIKGKGYKLISYISSKAIVLTNIIGDNCFILENNVIQPFVEIGNNVILWSGNHIGHHSKIADSVMFTSHVVLSGNCIVEKYCFFGVNSTIRDGLTISEGTFVSMSASIIKNTSPWKMYIGNPAVESNRTTQNL